MANHKGLKPGQAAPKSDQYEQVGPRVGKGKEVTVTKREPMPPTISKGTTYNLADPMPGRGG